MLIRWPWAGEIILDHLGRPYILTRDFKNRGESGRAVREKMWWQKQLRVINIRRTQLVVSALDEGGRGPWAFARSWKGQGHWFSHRASGKEYGPANILIFAQWDPMLEFWPLELYDNKFYCLSHQIVVYWKLICTYIGNIFISLIISNFLHKENISFCVL